jgi:hypothetical protein
MVFIAIMVLGVGLFLLGVKNLLEPFLTLKHGVNGMVSGALLFWGGASENFLVMASLVLIGGIFVYLNRPPTLEIAVARRLIKHVILEPWNIFSGLDFQMPTPRGRLAFESQVARMAIVLDLIPKMTESTFPEDGEMYEGLVRSEFTRKLTREPLFKAVNIEDWVDFRLRIYERCFDKTSYAPFHQAKALIAMAMIPMKDYSSLSDLDFSETLVRLKQSHGNLNWSPIESNCVPVSLNLASWRKNIFSLLSIDLELLAFAWSQCQE